MIIRLLISAALLVLAVAFIWFTANVIYLGVKEFFKIHGSKKAKKTS